MVRLPDPVLLQLRAADNALIDAQDACLDESAPASDIDALDAWDDIARARRILVRLIAD